MLDLLKNVFTNATSFLQDGVAPKNTPPVLQKYFESINHFSSKKFFIIMTSLAVLIFFFLLSIAFLFLLPKSDIIVTTYSVIFSKVTEIFGLIISVYIGAEGMVSLRYNSSSSAAIQGIAQAMDSTENSTENQNINDNEHIIEEGTDGAPEVRPYAMLATEE